MIRYVLYIVTLILIPAYAFSQQISEESLLDVNEARRIDRSQGIYTGSPFVHIDGIGSGNPKASGWMDEEKMRLFGTTDILQSKETPSKLKNTMTIPKLTFEPTQIRTTITPKFGKSWTTPLVDHTGDWSVMMQLTPTGDLIVTESIYLVKKTPDQFFSREIPKRSSDDSVKIIGLVKDKKNIPYHVTHLPESVKISDKQVLSPGEHQFELTYILPRIIHSATLSETFNINLIGSSWPFMIERFSGILLMPETVKVHNAQIGFGSNNLILPEGYETKYDQKGNVYFRTTHLLPAFADVQLTVSLDTSFLKQKSVQERLEESPDWYAVLLWSVLLIFYTLITLLTLAKQKKKNFRLFLTKINPIYFDSLINQALRIDFLNRLSAYQKAQNRRHFSTAFWKRIAQKRIGDTLMRCCLKFNLIKMYITELIILTACFFALLSYLKIDLSFSAKLTTLILPVFSLLALHPVLIKKQKKDMHASFVFLSDENTAFGLTTDGFKKLFIQLYPYILSVNRLRVWTTQFQKHNLTQADFSFLSSGKREEP